MDLISNYLVLPWLKQFNFQSVTYITMLINKILDLPVEPSKIKVFMIDLFMFDRFRKFVQGFSA